MNEETLKHAQEQLKQLRQPAMSGRQCDEGEGRSDIGREAELIKEQAEDLRKPMGGSWKKRRGWK